MSTPLQNILVHGKWRLCMHTQCTPHLPVCDGGFVFQHLFNLDTLGRFPAYVRLV